MYRANRVFHFYRDCILEKISEKVWEIRNGDKIILLSVDEKLMPQLYSGSLNPILGWQSKHYDVKEETSTLVNSGEFDGNCKFETLIII